MSDSGMPDRSPTADECYANTIVYDEDGQIVFAAWHPQWGGYVGKCWVGTGRCTPEDDGPCFDVRNYHDGEFPREDEWTDLHYCMIEQLFDFAETIQKVRGDFEEVDR